VQQRRPGAFALKAQVDQLQLFQPIAKGGVGFGVLAALEQRGALGAGARRLRQLRGRRGGAKPSARVATTGSGRLHAAGRACSKMVASALLRAAGRRVSGTRERPRAPKAK
jgi:hypothetical protein